MSPPMAQSARAAARRLACWLIYASSRRRWSRGLLNALYHRLSWRQKRIFSSLSFLQFRDRPAQIEEGSWELRFARRRLSLPLGNQQTWVDWNQAVTALGYDIELKQTYAAVLTSAHPPRVVFDVGANLGVHSLLFLVCGVHVVSFEPNPDCHAFLERIAQLNRVQPELQRVAVSDRPGTAQLRFPEGDTWLGTIREDVAIEASEASLRTVEVPVLSLDQYCDEHQIDPQLIKLDVEGSEEAVLRGAARLLRRARPLLLFEANTPEARQQLAPLLEEYGYRIAGLPYRPDAPSRWLSMEEFTACPGNNFAALPGPH